MIDDGKFRADLYYRLAAHIIAVPALRDRPEDIEALADLFICEGNERFNMKVIGVRPAAMRLLANHSWPGNVREFQNVIWAAVANHIGEVKPCKIDVSDLSSQFRRKMPISGSIKPYHSRQLEQAILRHLADHGPCTTTDLVYTTGRNRHAVGRVINKFAERRLVIVLKRGGKKGNLISALSPKQNNIL